MVVLSVTFKSNMKDRFDEGMSCINYFVSLYFIFRGSQMLLTFSRHQMMYNVFNIVLCTEVTYKGHFVIQ